MQKTKEAKKDHLLDIDHEYQHIIDGIDKKQKDINKSLLGRRLHDVRERCSEVRLDHTFNSLWDHPNCHEL